eukprot:TRINITY_DN5415_c0_g1_i2.p2 TRINITY_DN5415_c0_g1~~TRINITY_DN5415_c0_g1_i2.p2  ORF type:complete len:156 (+),score=20.32 TRINITY_DN5415_c0_g1_i2:31-468(+)
MHYLTSNAQQQPLQDFVTGVKDKSIPPPHVQGASRAVSAQRGRRSRSESRQKKDNRSASRKRSHSLPRQQQSNTRGRSVGRDPPRAPPALKSRSKTPRPFTPKHKSPRASKPRSSSKRTASRGRSPSQQKQVKFVGRWRKNKKQG